MKNGLYYEDGELLYYENDALKHAGVIKWEGAIYYINSKGSAVKGQYIVHREMTNGILKRGTYTFGDDYKLVKGSYIAPKKKSKILRKKTKSVHPQVPARERVVAWFKKKRNIAVIGCLALFVVFLVFISNSEVGHASVLPEVTTPCEQGIKLTLPTFDEDVLLCSLEAKKEYDGEMLLSEAIQSGDPYRPFYFEYNLEGATGHLFVGEQEDLSDAREYELTESDKYICIDNLKADTTYYYLAKVDGQEYLGSFHTAKSNRFVSIPGLRNTRDIGGYVTQDGKKIKQGLLIRGTELDGLVNASYYIPDDELENVQDTFGFVYDMDLRQPWVYGGQYISRLGTPHAFYEAPQYGEIFNPAYYESLRQIFGDLADSKKYPMYLHCTWGQDRTGTIVFLLQGILNVSEADMIREYRLTGYVNSEIASNNKMDVVINGLAPYAGDTLQERIVNFLITDVGVAESDVEAIRTIFLE